MLNSGLNAAVGVDSQKANRTDSLAARPKKLVEWQGTTVSSFRENTPGQGRDILQEAVTRRIQSYSIAILCLLPYNYRMRPALHKAAETGFETFQGNCTCQYIGIDNIS
jgi:hypothetical protein